MHQRKRVVRHVHHDISVFVVAELARQPAPALHVDEHGVDRIVRLAVYRVAAGVERGDGIGAGHAVGVEIGAGLERLDRFDHVVVIERVVLVARDVEPFAQRDHARVLHAGAQHAAFRHAHRRGLLAGGLGDLSAVRAQRGEFGLERLEAGLRRVVAVERLGDVGGVGDRGQHLGRLGRHALEGNVGRDAARVDAADLRVARIFQHRGGEMQLGCRQVVRRRRRGEIGRMIIARHQAVGRNLTEEGDGRLGARVDLAVAGPERLVVALLVELLGAGAVVLEGDVAVEALTVDEVAQGVGHLRVYAGRRRRGLRRFGGLGCGACGRGVLFRFALAWLALGRRGGLLLGLAIGLARVVGGGRRLSRLDIFHCRRRHRRQVRHRDHHLRVRLFGLLCEACVSGEREGQAESGRSQQALETDEFHRGLPTDRAA